MRIEYFGRRSPATENPRVVGSIPTLGTTTSGDDHWIGTSICADAPVTVKLPGGRAVPVHYAADQPTWIESRLQDFFGMTRGPAIGGGRVPLTLHLLAPNGRAVQVTNDLDSFWARHYPPLRRELGRRYPRHAWPEDGRTATPPPPKPPRPRP